MNNTFDPANFWTQLKTNNWFLFIVFIFGIGTTWGIQKTRFVQQQADIDYLKVRVEEIGKEQYDQDISLTEIRTKLKIGPEVLGVSTPSGQMQRVR